MPRRVACRIHRLDTGRNLLPGLNAPGLLGNRLENALGAGRKGMPVFRQFRKHIR